MKTSSEKNLSSLVGLIDTLAPLNNKFRTAKDSIEKIETLWELGRMIDGYLSRHNLKLHEVLYQIYDPHSTIKKSYITRDVGSYSYRIFKYFKNKEDIGKRLAGLKSYSLFMEAVPLIFNEKYNLSEEDKFELMRVITSGGDPKLLITRVRKRKKEILPIRNPRNQRSEEFDEEKLYLRNILAKLENFYKTNKVLPEKEVVFGLEKNKEFFVIILMALASDSFLDKTDDIDIKALDDNQKRLLAIVKSNNLRRARFRKWVMNSTELLRIAEAIHSLRNKDNYANFKNKFIDTEK